MKIQAGDCDGGTNQWVVSGREVLCPDEPRDVIYRIVETRSSAKSIQPVRTARPLGAKVS